MELSNLERAELASLDRLVESLPCEKRVYTSRAICFLMVSYYLQSRWSLSQGLRELFKRGEKLLGECRRTRIGEYSRNTSALSQARKKFPAEIFQSLILELFEQITDEQPLWNGRRVVTIDGTSISLEPTSSLRQKYPPLTNQCGESPFPVVLLTVAHDLMTGAAFEPEIGAMYGNENDTELAQAREIYQRLEASTIVVSDSAHGIRLMAVSALDNQLDVLFRLTKSRAESMLGKGFKANIDTNYTWKPSSSELRKYPQWKADDELRGRIITKRVKEDGKWVVLVLFTTLFDIPAQDITKLYLRRWEVEGEIRDVKKAIGLSRIPAKTSEMAEKEILAALVAYNLTRAIISVAAKQHSIENPKTISFTSTLGMISEYSRDLLRAKNQDERDNIFKDMLDWSASYINHPRKRKTYPREVHKRRRKYPPKKKIVSNLGTL